MPCHNTFQQGTSNSSPIEIPNLNIDTLSDTGDKGYILEVDFKYPKTLHSKHNEFPLAPEQIKDTEDMLSDCCNKIKIKFNIS